MTLNGNGADPRRPLIGVTMGDPHGIGPEVIIKALADEDLRRSARFAIFGSAEYFDEAADAAEINPYWWRVPREHGTRVESGVVAIDFDDLSVPPPGVQREACAPCGFASMQYLEEAVRGLKEGVLDALVTGPINKTAWSLANYEFRGHTDYLARRFDARRFTMMFAADDLRVALASTHLPLFELRHQFTIGLVFQPIDLMHAALRDWFGVERPRIGVLGLNPHAGEGGLLGDEEQRIIEPALTMARDAGIDVEGPLPADTAFVPENAVRFDGLVAMYHDQALIPVKMTAFHRAVNLTLGLPIVRTSPDHGTAFDIAGKSKADPGSTIAAIRMAIQIARIRAVDATIPPAAVAP